jgi:cytochrome c-type biogenesis protein CcmF
MLAIAIGGALALFAWRAPKLEGGAEFEPASRESALLLNNLLLCFAVTVVFFGTLYPLGLQAVTGERISVGAPYFAMLFAPAFVALLLLVPFGPRLSWRKSDLRDALRVLAPAAGIALVAGIVVLAVASPVSLAAAGSIALAFWVIAASSIDLRRKASAQSLTAQGWASALAHAGLGISLLGIVGTTVWRSEALDVLAPGQSLNVAGYSLRFDGVTPVEGPNYRAMRATIEISDRKGLVGIISPEKRVYPAEGQAVSNTSIRTTGFSDLYVALGDERGGGRWSVRAFVNPLAPFIWLGGAIMALGGMTTLWGRVRVRFARLAPAE